MLLNDDEIDPQTKRPKATDMEISGIIANFLSIGMLATYFYVLTSQYLENPRAIQTPFRPQKADIDPRESIPWNDAADNTDGCHRSIQIPMLPGAAWLTEGQLGERVVKAPCGRHRVISNVAWLQATGFVEIRQK